MIRVLVIIAGIDPWYFSWSMIGILRTPEQALVASCWNWSYFLNVCLHFSFLRVIVVHLWEVLCWWIASKVVPNDVVNLPWVGTWWTESQEASWQWCWQQTSTAVIDPALVNLDIEVISTALQRESGIVVVWFVKGLLCHPPWPIDRVYLIFGVEAFHQPHISVLVWDLLSLLEMLGSITRILLNVISQNLDALWYELLWP